jgi:hypothetical protein
MSFVIARRGLLLALIGLGAGGLARAAAERDKPHLNSRALGEWLRAGGAGILADPVALRRLGALYLDAHPAERSRARLSQLLIGAELGTIPARLRRAVARDWSGHHIAVVDGWLLARTEARLCAALHLEAGGRA